MTPPDLVTDSPRRRIAAERARSGPERIVRGCIELLLGGEADDELVVVLGGPHARALLTREDDPEQRYWLRVWAARGLLWCWDDSATDALLTALDDDAWRVREMALKVVARHAVEEAIDKVAALQDDPVTRVRAVAFRALVRLTEE